MAAEKIAANNAAIRDLLTVILDEMQPLQSRQAGRKNR
jgi:hypothetical protein